MSARAWTLFAARFGDLGHAVPVHQDRGRRDLAEPCRVVAARHRGRRAAPAGVEARRAPRARRSLEDPHRVRRRRDGRAVAAARLRRGPRELLAGGDPDRGRAALRRPPGHPLRPLGAPHPDAARGHAHRPRRRGRARGHRHRRQGRRAARRAGDPRRRVPVRDRADDREAPALGRGPARPRGRLARHRRAARHPVRGREPAGLGALRATRSRRSSCSASCAPRSPSCSSSG